MWNRKPLEDATGKGGELRAWHSRSFGYRAEQLHMLVRTPRHAIGALKRIADEDLKNSFVEWNAQGLVVWEDGEWSEWYNPEGMDIDEYAASLEGE